MKTTRTSITLPTALLEAAKARIPAHYCNNFSEYVADLIRDDVKTASADFKQTGPNSGQAILPQAAEEPQPYKVKKQRAG